MIKDKSWQKWLRKSSNAPILKIIRNWNSLPKTKRKLLHGTLVALSVMAISRLIQPGIWLETVKCLLWMPIMDVVQCFEWSHLLIHAVDSLVCQCSRIGENDRHFVIGLFIVYQWESFHVQQFRWSKLWPKIRKLLYGNTEHSDQVDVEAFETMQNYIAETGWFWWFFVPNQYYMLFCS